MWFGVVDLFECCGYVVQWDFQVVCQQIFCVLWYDVECGI